MPIAAGDTYVVALAGGGFGVARVVRDHSDRRKFCDHYGVARCYTVIPSHRVFTARPVLAEVDPRTLYLASIATNTNPELGLSTALVCEEPPRAFELLGNIPPTRDEAVAFAGTLGDWTGVLRQWTGERRHLYERYRPPARGKRATSWKVDLAKLRPPGLHLPARRANAFTARLQACLDELRELDKPSAARVDRIITATVRALNGLHHEHGHCLETIQREAIVEFLDSVQRISGGLVDVGALRDF